MELRPSVASYAFDAARFEELCRLVDTGVLDPAANRLREPPGRLTEPPFDLRPGAADAAEKRERWTRAGEDAIAAGEVAILVLNGGMATRFGGGAKGIVPVVPGREDISFLAIKLAEAEQRARTSGGEIPVVLMHSFATEIPSQAHLEAIGWAGVAEGSRYWFSQSILPRVLPDGTPLPELALAADLPDTTLYTAPGHGDTLGRLRSSGVLAALLDRGVRHILVSNVDNVGASLDPFVLGAHLEAVERGAAVSVEVVRRLAGDAGGCVAIVPEAGPAIVEGFRLPEGVDLEHYPHFNTNTLWFDLTALDCELPLTWFAVRKTIEWPDHDPRARGGKLDVVQFERLIGQATEFLPSAYLEVDREARFLPIKTREDLADATLRLEAFAREVGLHGPSQP